MTSNEDLVKRFKEDLRFHTEKRCSCTNDGRCMIAQDDAKMKLAKLIRSMLRDK